MRLDDSIVYADYQNNWLIYTSREELKVVPKDYIIVRWLKRLIQILFCCYCDVYGHMHMDRVVQGIWEMYKKENEEILKCQEKSTTLTTRLVQVFWKSSKKENEELSNCQEKYITLVTNLLDCNLGYTPIMYHRGDLIFLEKRILNYGKLLQENLLKVS